METKPTFEFDAKKHIYTLGGVPMTGVTSIIGVLAKPQLISWAARMATEYMEKVIRSGEYDLNDETVLLDVLEAAKSAHTKKKEAAAEYGTDTHSAVEIYIGHCIKEHDGKPYKHIDDTLQKFIDWAMENVDYFLFSERRMYNEELFIAGTADFAYIGKDGKKYMADFKTSSGIYGIDYFLQVAAYRMLAEGEGDEPYDGSTIVRLGKDGSFEVQQRYNNETDKEAFLACLTLYRAKATFTKVNK